MPHGKKLKCLQKSKSGFKYQLDIQRKDQSIKSPFSVLVKNKVEILEEINSAEEKVNLFKECIEQSIHEHSRKNKNRTQKHWRS